MARSSRPSLCVPLMASIAARHFRSKSGLSAPGSALWQEPQQKQPNKLKVPMLRPALIVALTLFLSIAVQAQVRTTPNNPVTPAASQSAREVLAQVRPAVIQIKSFFGSNTAQTSHGTGFAVKDGGVFITNYHVVADRVQYPGKYRLEYRTADGETG